MTFGSVSSHKHGRLPFSKEYGRYADLFPDSDEELVLAGAVAWPRVRLLAEDDVLLASLKFLAVHSSTSRQKDWPSWIPHCPTFRKTADITYVVGYF